MRLRRRRVVGTAALVMLAGSVLAGVPASVASPRTGPAKVQEISFTTQHEHILTTTSHKLRLTLDGISESEPGNTTAVNIHVRLTSANGVETHIWSFPLPGSSFVDTNGNAHAHLTTTSADFAPFGKVNLQFTQSGQKHVLTCGTSSVTSYHAGIQGRFAFKTNSTGNHAWGNYGTGSTRVRWVGSMKVYRGDDNCAGPTTQPCLHEVDWAAESTPIYGSGFRGGWTIKNGAKVGRVEAFSSVPLSQPATLASRSDDIVVSAPPPVLTVHTGLPSVAVTTNGGYMTGSATLASTTAKTAVQVSCNGNHHMKSRSWSFASFTNGTTPLTGHEQIEGPITLADSDNAGYIAQYFP